MKVFRTRLRVKRWNPDWLRKMLRQVERPLTPQFPPLPQSPPRMPWDFRPPEPPSCPKCGMKFKGPIGYVCPVPRCPTGLGGVLS